MTTTLKETTDQYVKHLIDLKQSASTTSTTRRILARMMGKLGEDKDLTKLLPAHVAGFYSDNAVDGKGKPLDEKTTAQLRRIVRNYLVWCQEQGYIETLPVPGEEKQIALRKQAQATNQAAKPKSPTKSRQSKAQAEGGAAKPKTEKKYQLGRKTTTPKRDKEVVKVINSGGKDYAMVGGRFAPGLDPKTAPAVIEVAAETTPEIDADLSAGLAPAE